MLPVEPVDVIRNCELSVAIPTNLAYDHFSPLGYHVSLSLYSAQFSWQPDVSDPLITSTA